MRALVAETVDSVALPRAMEAWFVMTTSTKPASASAMHASRAPGRGLTNSGKNRSPGVPGKASGGRVLFWMRVSSRSRKTAGGLCAWDGAGLGNRVMGDLGYRRYGVGRMHLRLRGMIGGDTVAAMSRTRMRWIEIPRPDWPAEMRRSGNEIDGSWIDVDCGECCGRAG